LNITLATGDSIYAIVSSPGVNNINCTALGIKSSLASYQILSSGVNSLTYYSNSNTVITSIWATLVGINNGTTYSIQLNNSYIQCNSIDYNKPQILNIVLNSGDQLSLSRYIGTDQVNFHIFGYTL